MLISFRMWNFKSFKNETVLTTEVGESFKKYNSPNTVLTSWKPALKNLLIFGPNGAGKSNLIEGVKTMRTMVLTKMADSNAPLDTYKFLMAPADEDEDTYFEVIFSTNEQFFEYEFSFNAQRITYERLTEQSVTSKRLCFERTEAAFKAENIKWQRAFDKTNRNELLIRTAADRNVQTAHDVFNWFVDDLLITDYCPNTPTVSELIKQVQNDQVRAKLLTFLKLADVNIGDLKVLEEPATREWKLANSNCDNVPATTYRLLAEHKVYDSAGQIIGHHSIPLSKESRGTQKIILIALTMINAERSQAGKTVLIDNFEGSLHIEVTKALVSIFNSEANQNQFILTTHKLSMLDAAVRSDQIYLVEKDFKGESFLTSVFDFNDARKSFKEGHDYMQEYLAGRFGARPVIDSQAMLNALTGLDDFYVD